MQGPLCSEEYEALRRLGELMQDPEKYGVSIDRGTNPEAAKILDDALDVLLTVWYRRPAQVGVV